MKKSKLHYKFMGRGENGERLWECNNILYTIVMVSGFGTNIPKMVIVDIKKQKKWEEEMKKYLSNEKR